MEKDPDLIARLYPAHTHGPEYDVVVNHPWASQEPCDYDSTEEPLWPADGGLPFIELRFSHLTRGSSGFVFGRDKKTCDIVLSNLSAISRNHFALTFRNTFHDGRYRLVVRDLGSSHGTEVKYDGRSDGPQSNFDWVVSGTSVSAAALRLIIQPQKWFSFRLVVAYHDKESPAYIANVEKFCKGAVSTENVPGSYIPGMRL
jgi:serine/threonine-protein kinase Chk2